MKSWKQQVDNNFFVVVIDILADSWLDKIEHHLWCGVVVSKTKFKKKKTNKRQYTHGLSIATGNVFCAPPTQDYIKIYATDSMGFGRLSITFYYYYVVVVFFSFISFCFSFYNGKITTKQNIYMKETKTKKCLCAWHFNGFACTRAQLSKIMRWLYLLRFYVAHTLSRTCRCWL